MGVGILVVGIMGVGILGLRDFVLSGFSLSGSGCRDYGRHRGYIRQFLSPLADMLL